MIWTPLSLQGKENLTIKRIFVMVILLHVNSTFALSSISRPYLVWEEHQL